MAVEVDGLLEHAVLLRQRYATGKHAGLGQTRDSALIIERTETAWYVVTDEGVIYGIEFVSLVNVKNIYKRREILPEKAIDQRIDSSIYIYILIEYFRPRFGMGTEKQFHGSVR